MQDPVSMQDIARHLGLSKMTVSKALRGLPNVSPSTGERVRREAEKMGYRPNPMVSSLMQQVRTGKISKASATIAYIARNRAALHNEESQSCIEGATHQFARCGYRIDTFSLDDYDHAAQLAKVMIARGIAGFISGPMDDSQPWSGFPWHLFASVSAGLGHYRLPNLLVRRNISQGIRLVGDQLNAAGFRRPGILFNPQQNSELDHIAQGANLRLMYNGPRDFSLIHAVDTASHLKRWLDTAKPDVVILQYQPHLHLLLEAGFDPNGDIPLVSLKRSPHHSKLAGIDSRSYPIGSVAIQLLDNQIQLNRKGVPDAPQTLILDCQWQSSDAFARAAHLNAHS